MATVKKLSETVYEVSATRSGEELKHLKKHVLVHFKDAKVDGFRKGHVPADVLEKKFKKEIEGEILNHIISEEYRKAVEENNLSPIADIKLEKYENNEDNVEVVFTIPVLPEITLGDYKSVKVEKEALDVNDEKVNAEIEIMRSNAGKLKEVADDEAAKDKDVANINFEGFVDGEAFDGGKAEGFDLTLGSKSFIDTFEDQIIGHKKGDEFDVNVTFPEEYHAENLKGQEAVFKVKVHEVKTKELPELTDEFAKDVDDSVETLAELKEKFRKELEEAKAAAADEAVADEALRKAVENAEIVELPHEMVHDEVHRQMEHYLNDMRRNGISPEMYYQITGTTEADLHKMMEKDADVRTKTNLVLEQIVKEEGIEATDEDVANEVKELAAQYGMEEDAVRAAVSVDMLKNDIAMKKALAVITESAKEA